MERQQDYVLRRVEERGIRLIRLWFTDVHGQLKSFAISPAELETAFEQGMVFDGSSIDGFSRIAEEDTIAKPDASTFELMSWSGSEENAARMFCDIERAAGSPYPGDSRQVLRRVMEQVSDAGEGVIVVLRNYDGTRDIIDRIQDYKWHGVEDPIPGFGKLLLEPKAADA